MVLSDHWAHTIIGLIFSGGIGMITWVWMWKHSDFIKCYQGDRDDCHERRTKE